MFDRPAYINAIMRFVDAPMVKVLTGVRRSGKSTIPLMLIEQLKKRGIPSERILSYRFDSMKYDGLTAKALCDMLLASPTRGQKTYIFLDEIQEIRDNYPKYVLRTDEFAEGNHEGIKVMHVADFLLSDAY